MKSSPRRDFLTATLLAALSTTCGAQVPNDSDRYASAAPKPHDQMRVRIEVEVNGNVTVSDKPISSRDTENVFPIRSKAILDYEERPLAPEGADVASQIVAAERYYHEASSTSTLNRTETERSLRDSVKHALVRRETLPETIYSENSFYTHDELSLLKSPVSSTAVDRLLPTGQVSAGDRYEIAGDAIASVLNLTSVDTGKIDGEVLDVTADAIKFKLQGEFEGSIDGVTTRIRLIGKMTFDRKSASCSWLAMAIHETREVGRAEPGFDIAATIRMVRRPMEAPVALPTQPARVAFDQPVPTSRSYVELQSRELAAGAMMDRRWRMIQDRPGSAIMRMIDHDQSVAQCNLRPLVRLKPGSQWTLEAFEAEIRRTLGNQLVSLVEGDQRESAQGLQVLRIVADGESQGVPVRWIMMHFSDEHGRRLQATFTMSADQVEQFAANDAQLADSLRFLAEPTQEDAEPGAEVARADDAEVDSASDLK